jgi:hypothetical protein
MQIASIVAGAAIALAAATSLASAGDEVSPPGGVPGESPTFGPNTGSGIFDLSNENPGMKYMEGGRMMDSTPYVSEHDVEDPGMGWIFFGKPPTESEPPTTPPGSSTPTTPGPSTLRETGDATGIFSTAPTAPDPNAVQYRVKVTFFPFLKISIDGSKVVKTLGKRTARIKLPSGKTVTEGITIMQTEDGTIYGIGAGLHNFGPMHESRNQPFPDQKQYSFDKDPIPRPPTPGAGQSVEASDQDTVPFGGY